MSSSKETVEGIGEELRILCKILLRTSCGQVLLHLWSRYEVLIGALSCFLSLKALWYAHDFHSNLMDGHCSLYSYFDVKMRVLQEISYHWCSLYTYGHCLYVVVALLLLIKMCKTQTCSKVEFHLMTSLMTCTWLLMLCLCMYMKRGVDTTCERNIREGTIAACDHHSYSRVDWFTFSPKHMRGYAFPSKLRYSERLSWEALVCWTIVVGVHAFRYNRTRKYCYNGFTLQGQNRGDAAIEEV